MKLGMGCIKLKNIYSENWELHILSQGSFKKFLIITFEN